LTKITRRLFLSLVNGEEDQIGHSNPFIYNYCGSLTLLLTENLAVGSVDAARKFSLFSV
jgi:hypothetical protein